MGLTQTDLQEIRSIVHSVVALVDQKLDALIGKVEALENDVKEIDLTAKVAGVTLPRH